MLLRWMRSKSPLGQAARGLKSLLFLALFRFIEQQEEAPSSSAAAAAVSSLPRKNPFWEACSYSSPSSSLLLRDGTANGGGSPRSNGGNGNGNGSSSRRPSSPCPAAAAAASIPVSPAKVATEATLLARTVDASKLPSASEASARFSALGFAPAKEAKAEGEAGAAVTLSADAVVVGSGAGGGVAAALLAASGLRVVVLEKGRYFAASACSSSFYSSSSPSSESNFEPLDLSEKVFSQTYERGTLCSSRDLSATALAGSTLGGGTRINWCASFPTPHHVREEWSRVGGLPVTPPARGEEEEKGTEFDEALAAVCSRMRVSVNVGDSRGAPSDPSSPSSPSRAPLPDATTGPTRGSQRVSSTSGSTQVASRATARRRRRRRTQRHAPPTARAAASAVAPAATSRTAPTPSWPTPRGPGPSS